MMLLRRDETERPEPIGYNNVKAAKLMQQYNLDALILTSPENTFYASGLPLLHQEINPILFALRNQYPTIVLIQQDGEESLVLWDIFDKKLTWIKDVKGCLNPTSALRALGNFLKKMNIGDSQIGVESTLPFYIQHFLTEKFPSATISIADELLMDMRLIKSDEETRRITESTRIAEQAISNMIEATEIGVSDLELIKVGKRTMIEEGANGWDHFTMSIGESDPEAPGIGLQVQDQQLSRFDIGALYQGYVSDVSRHVYTGAAPPDLKETIEAIVQVQNACQEAIKPNVDPQEIITLSEQTWREAGRQDTFILMAHSLGLNTEEYHFFDPMKGALKRKFQEGNVFDLEAWTLLKGYGTIGNEDTYVVTANGCKRISTLDMNIFEKA